MTWPTVEEIMLGVVGHTVFSAAMYAMPSPTSNSSAFYVFLYRFLQYIAANLDKAKNGASSGNPKLNNGNPPVRP